VNSEDIKRRFGNYHIVVLAQNEAHRVASLCSEHNGAMVCRTLAVTYFCQPIPQAALPADHLIRQGHSIGSTLSGAGLVIQRRPLLEATTLSGQGFERLSAGTVKSGTGLLIRLYRLEVGTDTGSVRPYATIAEAHHPEHLPATSALPDCETLASTETGEPESGALATLLSNLQ
jgi:hypothetical protein